MVADRTGAPGRTARAVTAAFSPTLLMAVLSPLVGGLAAGPGGVGWGLAGVVFIAAVPAAIVHVGVVRGRWSDHHLSRREDRALPLTLSALSVTAGVALLALAGAPRAIVALQIAVLAVLVLATAITAWWKISFHVAVVAASATALCVVGGAAWLAALLAVPLVGWSRLRLRAHTGAQVLAGAVLGAGTTALVLGVAGAG